MRHLLLWTLLIIGLSGSYQSAFAADNAFSAEKVRLGDTVFSILRKHGFTPNEREQILRSIPSLHSFILSPEMTYLVSKKPGHVTLRMHDHEQNLVFTMQKSPQRILGKADKPNYRTEVEEHEGRVRGSLLGSIHQKVPSNWVSSRFMDAYKLEHNLEKLPAGARFWFRVEKLYDGDFFVGYGEVLETSLEIHGENVHKEFIRLKKGGVFVNAEDLLSNRPFYAPVNYLRIASQFQKRRRHPITRRVQAHLGIDFELPQGAPIYAPQNGVVVRLGKNRVAGFYVVLKHPNGMETAYNHMRSLPNLQKGQKIKAGQRIGEVGCTGYCTKAHLHFALKHKGKMVDPAQYIRAYPAHSEAVLQKKVASRN